MFLSTKKIKGCQFTTFSLLEKMLFLNFDFRVHCDLLHHPCSFLKFHALIIRIVEGKILIRTRTIKIDKSKIRSSSSTALGAFSFFD